MTHDTLVFAISQSGETADTLGALRESRRKGYRTLGICNNVASTIARESDGGVYMHAGPEIGVAATKSFTSQVTILALIGLLLGRMRHLSHLGRHAYHRGARKVAGADRGDASAERTRSRRSRRNTPRRTAMLFFGRQFNFPVALEAALKMKEITYLFAEGHPSAELKHGIIALGPARTALRVHRAGRRCVLEEHEQHGTGEGPQGSVSRDHQRQRRGQAAPRSRTTSSRCRRPWNSLSPILTVIPLQLLAYHLAVELGRDVDKPRNLAKSVTVE